MDRVSLLKVKSGTNSLRLGELQWVAVQDDFTRQLRYIANYGDIFYFFTMNEKTPRGQIVRYDVDVPVVCFLPN
jgi:hypothetical protein